MNECKYYEKRTERSVKCMLCPHHCIITDGKRGCCGSRHNVGGVLVSDVYGHPCAIADDPIEKKPLVGFHPGTRCLSIACTGCNLRCLNCQNSSISQAKPYEVQNVEISPEDVVALAEKYHLPGIAYTYTEPLTWMEYMIDTAHIARKHGLWNILVSAGYVCQKPLNDLLPFIDAANIDIKSMSDAIYMRLNGCHLQPVLDTVLTLHGAGVWVELTNLLIPTINDQPELIRSLCRWVVDNGMANQPLHFSRFFPCYRLNNLSPTPISVLRMAESIAYEEGIKQVNLGNV